MGHHAEHVAGLVEDAGDVALGTVRVGLIGEGALGVAIPEDDTAVAFEPVEGLGIGEIVAVMVGDRAADDLAPAGSRG